MGEGTHGSSELIELGASRASQVSGDFDECAVGVDEAQKGGIETHERVAHWCWQIKV